LATCSLCVGDRQRGALDLHRPNRSDVRVGLDVRYLSHRLTGGVRTYVYHLARELPHAAPDVEFVYYADTKAPLELQHLPPNVTVRRLAWRSPLSTLANDWRIAAWMARDGVHVGHFPANYGPRGPFKLVVTVHDALNLFSMSEHLRGFGRTPRKVGMMAYLGWQTRRSVRSADRVITVSHHARHEILAKSGCAPDRIAVVHEAADPRFVPVTDTRQQERLRSKWQLPRFAILADAIKNPGFVLEAWRRLPSELRAETHVLFFSREATPRTALRTALSTDPALRFLSQPTTEDLVELMNISDVLVFPSFYEGFGLPLVEAMSCGTPVIASARGAIPEVVGDAGLLFDLEHIDVLVGHLRAVLTDSALRGRLKAAALRRASMFSWRKAAAETLEVYRLAVHPST
jgi:glycosyltransferase involved in cell wall biosynthesis